MASFRKLRQHNELLFFTQRGHRTAPQRWVSVTGRRSSGPAAFPQGEDGAIRVAKVFVAANGRERDDRAINY
jgi:hypothetical protein